MKARVAMVLALAAASPAAADCGRGDPVVSPWLLGNGVYGQSPDATINAAVSVILADVQRVRFNATDAYVEATGIPSYAIGPFPDGNPNIPSDQHWLWRFPRVPPVPTGVHAATPLGPVGALLNGVAFFNPKDARSYQNMNVWHQNAAVVEGPGMDAALGHPAPGGAYHHHQHPPSLLARLGDDGTHHSPLIGFAFDGYPLYGPYGFANADGTGGVRRLVSSYRLRSITTRTTLPDGTALAPSQYGPPVSATYPLGYYIEDFEYVAGLGDLDEYNGRFEVTPEHPAGIYAYCATVDASGASAYPYMVGPTYYGPLMGEDQRQTVTVPSGTCTFSPTCAEGDCPGSCTDGIDDDGNGQTDCADPGCALDPACANADGDGDTVVDSLDCAPADPSAFALPPEIPLLRVAPIGDGTQVTLSWTDVAPLAGTGTRYDVAADRVSVLVASRAVTAPCVAQGLAATTLVRADSTPGDATYYLVRAVNACGPPATQGWGTTSLGQPHLACP